MVGEQVTFDVAWQWISYATRRPENDVRERLAGLSHQHVLVIGQMLCDSPLVHPHRVLASERKPKIKQEICRHCRKDFEYDGSRGPRHLFCSKKCKQNFHAKKHRAEVKAANELAEAQARELENREKILKGKT